VSLRALALVSGVYDLLLGVSMLAAAAPLARLFGAPAPVPLVNAWLNGVFTLTLAGGYFWAASDPAARRGYFWWAGVFAKGLGALTFLVDHFVNASPSSYLLFAACDGTLAVLSFVLLSTRSPRPDGAAPRR
jgi:hypothetical protein